MIRFHIPLALLTVLAAGCGAAEQATDVSTEERFPHRGYNLLSNHRPLGLATLDAAQDYGVTYVELSHYQLIHNLSDLRKEPNRTDANFFIDEIHRRGMDAFVWDHAFYDMDYYPDRFKVAADTTMDFTHHTKHFEGGTQQQLDLDDPQFWQWVYADYDSLLALAPDLDGVTLTFIETGSYVIYQHSDVLKTPQEKLAALVDSLGGYFIDEKGLDLHIRTFIYNQFERQTILNALQLIERDDLRVMIKMVPHDWFVTFPYQNYVDEIPFPVIIEYDLGGEYLGENIIASTLVDYYTRAFQHYAQYDHVVGYCARTSRFETTTSVGNPAEINLYTLSRLTEEPQLTAGAITTEFLTTTYGAEAVELLRPAFDSALAFQLSTMYTLGTHTADHSRLNFHRWYIYVRHTTGEWYPPDEQMYFVGHGVNKTLHNYKDILNALSFPLYKTDTAGLRQDIGWVLDSGWLQPTEAMTWEYLQDIITEKEYGIGLAESALAQVEQALPLVADSTAAAELWHTFRRSVIFAQERAAVAQAVYGYRLWSRGESYQTPKLQALIWEGLEKGDSLINLMETYQPPPPKGQWRWPRDREAYQVYRQAIAETGWEEFGLAGVTVPKP